MIFDDYRRVVIGYGLSLRCLWARNPRAHLSLAMMWFHLSTVTSQRDSYLIPRRRSRSDSCFTATLYLVVLEMPQILQISLRRSPKYVTQNLCQWWLRPADWSEGGVRNDIHRENIRDLSNLYTGGTKGVAGVAGLYWVPIAFGPTISAIQKNNKPP